MSTFEMGLAYTMMLTPHMSRLYFRHPFRFEQIALPVCPPALFRYPFSNPKCPLLVSLIISVSQGNAAFRFSNP